MKFSAACLLSLAVSAYAPAYAPVYPAPQTVAAPVETHYEAPEATPAYAAPVTTECEEEHPAAPTPVYTPSYKPVEQKLPEATPAPTNAYADYGESEPSAPSTTSADYEVAASSATKMGSVLALIALLAL